MQQSCQLPMFVSYQRHLGDNQIKETANSKFKRCLTLSLPVLQRAYLNGSKHLIKVQAPSDTITSPLSTQFPDSSKPSGSTTAAPRAKVILGSMLAAMAISGMVSVLIASGGEKVPTMTTDWKGASKEYMKFQKMNPIFGMLILPYLMTLQNLSTNFSVHHAGVGREEGK